MGTINTVSTSGGVAIRSSDGERMFLGGNDSGANPGIYLTDAELGRITTSAGGSITFGDSNYASDIFIKTATLATTPGAATIVVQLTGLSGAKIELDDDLGTATALNGNGGTISLTAGNGGIRARNNNNGAAEIATTGATVTLTSPTTRPLLSVPMA